MKRDLLRCITAGSVDDGKSTLVGRLLCEAGGVYEDQLQAVQRASRQGLDLAFITDGLRAEREQGITIDVAYRYFETERRKFIIADTPGHEQYTRNMVTGASTAQLAVILLDARKGVLPQTVRHAYIAWLLGIRRILVAINKMDLVGFSADVFTLIQEQFELLAKKLAGVTTYFVPVVALDGDNVVHRSARIPWFAGPSLLEYLETVPVQQSGATEPFRMAVQYVIRSDDDSRAYAGQIVSGSVAPGDEVFVLPARLRARIKSLVTYDGELPSAFAPMSTSLCLDQHLDISRGDMFSDPNRIPHVTTSFRAAVVWMSEVPLAVRHPYLIKHTSQQVCANITAIVSKRNISTLEEEPSGELGLNEIGMVAIETHRPLFCDLYQENRSTGAFILMDAVTNLTVGAGMIVDMTAPDPMKNVRVTGEQGLTVWFTGLSSAGKTTISRAAYERLWAQGHRVELLDGDDIRRHLSRDLGFSKQDRDENIRRIGFLAEMLARNGVIALVSAISPYRAVRDEMRERIPNFVEVYVNAPLEVCEQRDVKGLYRKARMGQIVGLTGIDDPYEPPLLPEIECRTDKETLGESVDKVLKLIESQLG